MSKNQAKEINSNNPQKELICSSDLPDGYSFAIEKESPDKIVSFKPTTKLRLKIIQPTEQEQISRDKIVKFYADLIKIYAYSD